MWKLSIEDDQGNKTVVNLVRDEYRVGRAEENTVRLTERNISRHHALIRKNGVGWVISDEESYNGCFVNGVRVSEPQPLEHGDLVQLGDYRLEVTDESMMAGVQTTQRISTAPGVQRHALLGQPDRLVMLVGPAPGTEFPLVSERMVIGRGEECDIAINHSSVSRVHSEIHALGDGRYELIDRGSANGIRINGSELQRSLIDARDTIELGDVVLKFIPAGQVYVPGAAESQQINALSAAMAAERLSPAPGVEAHRPVGGLPPVVKIGLGIAVVGLALVLGVVAFSGDKKGVEATPAAQQGDAVRTLGDAMALFRAGRLEEAHQKALEVPEDSNLRQSEDFKNIEAAWADALFKQSAIAADPEQKRALLDRIAKTPSVDSIRRKRAASAIAELDSSGSVNPADLPSSPTGVPKPSATEETPDKPPAPSPQEKPVLAKNPFASKPTATAAPPAPKPTETQKPADTDLGDRQALTRSKDALKSKVASGKATDKEKRYLRALCRQLGDMSCVN